MSKPTQIKQPDEQSDIADIERKLIVGMDEERQLASDLYTVRAANRLLRAQLQNLTERL